MNFSEIFFLGILFKNLRNGVVGLRNVTTGKSQKERATRDSFTPFLLKPYIPSVLMYAVLTYLHTFNATMFLSSFVPNGIFLTLRIMVYFTSRLRTSNYMP